LLQNSYTPLQKSIPGASPSAVSNSSSEEKQTDAKRRNVAAAFAAIPQIDPATAARVMTAPNTLTIDLRQGVEIALRGRIKGAVAVPFDRLAALADESSPDHDPRFNKNKTILLYCSSGAQAALGGMILKELGYLDVRNLGTFKRWVQEGGAVEG
jgi:rhodanese-related sulfurtransferase